MESHSLAQPRIVHAFFQGSAVRSRASRIACSAMSHAWAALAAIGRHWALLAGAFADGLGVFPPDSGRVQQAGRAWNSSQGGPISTETRVNIRVLKSGDRLGRQVGIVRIEAHFARRGRRSRPCQLPMPDRRSASHGLASTSTGPEGASNPETIANRRQRTSCDQG